MGEAAEETAKNGAHYGTRRSLLIAFFAICTLSAIAFLRGAPNLQPLPSRSRTAPGPVVPGEDEVTVAKLYEPVAHKVLPFRERPPDGMVADFNQIEHHCRVPDNTPETCLEFLRRDFAHLVAAESNGLPSPPPCREGAEPMLFHVYWEGRWEEHIALTLKSYVLSQPPECSQLWIWTEADHASLTSEDSTRTLQRQVGRAVHVKKWNSAEQLRSAFRLVGMDAGTQVIRTRLAEAARKPVAFSDMVRFVVLLLYGGLYVDADTLLLRDFRPLYHSNVEFSTQWSSTPNFNTAVLRLLRNSTVARALFTRAVRNGMRFHPFNITKYSQNIDSRSGVSGTLTRVPVHVFDPVWTKNDRIHRSSRTVPDFLRFTDAVDPEFKDCGLADHRGRQLEDFFNGAYAYHTHRLWNTPIAPSSWLGALQRASDEFLCGLRPNTYGEHVDAASESTTCAELSGKVPENFDGRLTDTDP